VAGGPELGPWIRDDHIDSSASSEIVKTKLSPPSPRIEEVHAPSYSSFSMQDPIAS